MLNLSIVLILTFLIVLSEKVQSQDKEEDWKEIYRKDNIVFSVLHNTSRITRTVNSVIKVENFNDYKVFIQFTPAFYCQGIDGEAILEKEENTYLAALEGNSLHSFQVCIAGQVPIVKIKQLKIHQTNELDAGKRIKH